MNAASLISVHLRTIDRLNEIDRTYNLSTIKWIMDILTEEDYNKEFVLREMQSLYNSISRQ